MGGNITREGDSALNQGIRATDSEFVLLLNSDTEALTGTLDIPVRALQSRSEVGMTTPVLVDGGGDIIQMSWAWTPLFLGEVAQRFFSPRSIQTTPWRRRLVERLQGRERVVPSICGAAMFVRREALERAGGVDEGFVLYFEDSDLCLRLRRLGWDLLLVPRARIVHHLARSTAARPGRMALLYCQSQIRFYRKHGSRTDRALLSLYLRLKHWRIYLLRRKGMPPDERDFHRALRGVLKGTERVGL